VLCVCRIDKCLCLREPGDRYAGGPGAWRVAETGEDGGGEEGISKKKKRREERKEKQEKGIVEW